MRALAAVVVATFGAGSGAFAQDGSADDRQPEQVELAEGEARALFEAGSLAFAGGDFERALDHFQRSYEVSGRPRLLYNAGLAADRLRRDAVALDAFERYLEGEPDSPHRVAVESRIAALRVAVADRERERERADRERSELAERATTAEARAASTPVIGRWWFWTIVGLVVAGAAVTTVLLLTQDPGVQDPIPGTQGVVVATLRY